MADFSKFRTSIGGFHRGDVADYIEAMAIEHKKDLRRLNDANEKLESEKAALEAELASAKEELERKTAELKITKEEDASLQQQIESLAQEAAELAQRAADAEEKAAALESAQDAQAPGEDADEAACDAETNLPEKELEAYRRAEAMERNALSRAERLKAKLTQLCEGARTRYTDSGEELEALTQDLTSVLDRMRDTLADLQVAFDETENAFDELESMNAE